MNKLDFDISDSEASDESNGEAEDRIRKIMGEIFKHGDKLSSQEDIDKMADHCTNMLTKMKTTKGKEDRQPRKSAGSFGGGGDHARKTESQKENRKGLPQTASKDEFMASLMGGPSLRDIMTRKKEKPNVGEIYKQKLAEKMKSKQAVPMSGMKGLFGKSMDGKWREKVGNIMDNTSSKSSKSTESSSEESEESLEEKMFRKTMSSERTKKQSIPEKSTQKVTQNSPRSAVNEFEAARKKAEEWLKTREPALRKNKLQLEDLSSGSDSEPLPSKLNLPKKNEQLLKSKRASISMPKKVVVPPSPSTKTTSTAQKKPTLTNKPPVSSSTGPRKTVKKTNK